MRNYTDRIYKLPYGEVIDIYENDVKEEIDKEVFNKRWSLYCSVYPYMLKGEMKGLSYEEFNKMLDGESLTSKTHKNTDLNAIKYNDMDEESALKFLNELEKKPVKMVKRTGQNISN